MTDQIAKLAGEVARWRIIERAALNVAEHARSCADTLVRADYAPDDGTFAIERTVLNDMERADMALDDLERAYRS